MSGPKVVRVVTREELVAAGEHLLARLDAELKHWRAVGSAISQPSPSEVETTLARREQLLALLRSDRFDEFRKAAVSEINYLQADRERLREAAAQAEATRITAHLRTRENAYALIRALKRSAVAAPALISELEQVAHGAGQEIPGRSAEDALRDGFRAMSGAHAASARPQLTDQHRALAGRLAEGLQDSSFDAWRDAQVLPDDERRFQDLARRLAVLASLADPQASQGFAERISKLQQGDPDASRHMRLDSLVLEIEQAVSKAKEHLQLLAAAEELVRQLEVACADDSKTLRTDLERAVKGGEHSIARTLIGTGQAVLAEALKRSSADARRQAVLRGLAQLGYEVRENMAAAWAKNGRLVLTRPDRTGYGVELAGSADIERMQVRAVAFSDDRDARRDLDAETIWCSEFSKLRAGLEASGSQLVIERAAGVGEVPLRVVEHSQNNVPNAHVKGNTRLKG